jgi:hypothetical protein
VSLSQRIKDARPDAPPSSCGIRKALDALGLDDAEALVQVVYERRDLSSATVSRLLAEEGIDIGAHTIGRHRRRQCATCNRR